MGPGSDWKASVLRSPSASTTQTPQRAGSKPATLLTVQFARDVDPLNPCPFVTASLALTRPDGLIFVVAYPLVLLARGEPSFGSLVWRCLRFSGGFAAAFE